MKTKTVKVETHCRECKSEYLVYHVKENSYKCLTCDYWWHVPNPSAIIERIVKRAKMSKIS